MDSNNEFSDEKKRSFVPEAKVDPHFASSFHDIEDSFRQFDCSDLYPIQKWITYLEDMAQFLG